MKYDELKISEAIEKALRDSDMQPSEISDTAFHMTDWLSDLEEWVTFCEKPGSISSDQLQELLMSFLIHVPNHVAAASKIVTGFPIKDIFEVGAIEERNN